MKITKVPNDPEGLIWHVDDGCNYRCATKKMALDRVKMWNSRRPTPSKKKRDSSWDDVFPGFNVRVSNGR